METIPEMEQPLNNFVSEDNLMQLPVLKCVFKIQINIFKNRIFKISCERI